MWSRTWAVLGGLSTSSSSSDNALKTSSTTKPKAESTKSAENKSKPNGVSSTFTLKRKKKKNKALSSSFSADSSKENVAPPTNNKAKHRASFSTAPPHVINDSADVANKSIRGESSKAKDSPVLPESKDDRPVTAVPVPDQNDENVAGSSKSGVEAEVDGEQKEILVVDEEDIREISFFYSEDDERFLVLPEKNPLAVIIGIDSLTKFNKTFSNPIQQRQGQGQGQGQKGLIQDKDELPWNSFSFIFAPPSPGGDDDDDECEEANLKSPDFIKFFNKFGTVITRLNFTFLSNSNRLRGHDDESGDAHHHHQQCQVQDFFKILSNQKLPNLEYLSLGMLPNDPMWKSPKVKGQDSNSNVNFEVNKLPALRTLVLQKYTDYSKHSDFLGLLLAAAPNLNSVQNFQLALLDTFEKNKKLHTIKDIEIVHPAFLSETIWIIDDYLEALKKFAKLTSDADPTGQEGQGQSQGQGQIKKIDERIKLEQLLVIPDESFKNEDESINSTFSKLYSDILEGSKDSLKIWSMYPLSPAALPAPSTGNSPVPMTALTTLKLYEFQVCRSGILIPESIFKLKAEIEGGDEKNFDTSLIFPNLTKVEIAASKYFHKYDHSIPNLTSDLTSNSNLKNGLKFPLVTTLELTLGSSRPAIGQPFLYNLYELFRDLTVTFPNISELTIRCYQKLRYILRAISKTPGFKEVKSLHIECIEVEDFINQYKRRDPDEEKMMMKKKNQGKRNKKGNGGGWRGNQKQNQNPNHNKSNNQKKKSKSKQEKQIVLMDAFLDVLLNNKDEDHPEPSMMMDLEKIWMAPQHGSWALADLKLLGNFTVGFASRNLDLEPYFEGYRMKGPLNFNIGQVARPKEGVDIGAMDVLGRSCELELDDSDGEEHDFYDLYDDDSDAGSDFDDYYYNDPYGGLDAFQRDLERKMDFMSFWNNDY